MSHWNNNYLKPADPGQLSTYEYTFLWEGIDRSGAIVKGEQTAENILVIKKSLLRLGIKLTKISKKNRWNLSFSRIRKTEITLFTRQIATLLRAGLSFIQILELVNTGYSNPKMRQLVNILKYHIENGCTITDALTKQPRYFNELYRHLIMAGECSGTLDIIFERLANHTENMDKLIGKIKKALFYPAAIITVACLVTIFLLIFIVPQFQTLFANFGAALPWPTQLTIGISNFIQHYGLILFVFVSILISSASYTYKSQAFRTTIDRFLLQLPIIGSAFKHAALARFARTLATTFSAGLSLIDALQITAGATGNRIYAAATLQTRERVIQGQTLQCGLQHSKLFPNIAIQLITVGEESGTLEKMLANVAEIYEKKVDELVENFSSYLEPVIMIILGFLIGGLIIAMYLPIFKLGSIV